MKEGLGVYSQQAASSGKNEIRRAGFIACRNGSVYALPLLAKTVVERHNPCLPLRLKADIRIYKTRVL
jgi:hypothetical protein